MLHSEGLDLDAARKLAIGSGAIAVARTVGAGLFSKRVMAQIRSPVRVRTNRPVPWRMPVGARR